MPSVKAMKKLLIVKAGSTFTETAMKYGDFEDMIRRGSGLKCESVDVIDAVRCAQLPAPDSCCGAIITGAHCMVTDNLHWSLALEAWIRSIVTAAVPLLGICYGHQLLGRAMGGQVSYHPRGKEVGTFDIRLRPDAREDQLFSALPAQFPVHTTHSQAVLALPSGAVLLAENDFEPHHAFRIGACAWGVQFHPEYDIHIMRDYILAQADSLTDSGRDIESLLHDVRQTPAANSILEKFASLALP